MLFTDAYRTIKIKSEGYFRDRGSKFIAFAFPVKNQEEIKTLLDGVKKEHPSASHHCYAWRLGADKLAYRVNDDGEPSGTAGKPIFSQIQSNDLTNILIVVVRYFGGSLLGVNGLIHAYKQAASEAINHAEILESYVLEEYEMTFAIEDMNMVMRLLKEHETKIVSNTYDESHTIVFRIRKSKVQELEKDLKALYRVKMKYIQNQ